MPAPRMPLSKRTRSQRGSPSLNSTSSLSDDEDAITPCPIKQVEEQHAQPKEEQAVAAQRKGDADLDNSRRSSWRHSQGFSHLADHDQHGHDLDAELLWHRMLTVQQIYGCYNSARMTAALEMGNDGGIVRKFNPPPLFQSRRFSRAKGIADVNALPVASRTCLDLLNDSLNQLPEDERREVEEFLEHDHPSRKRHSVWSHIGIRT